ncbi:MAG: hypothetical protein R3F62_18405 [Planctomycetota bacterium]
MNPDRLRIRVEPRGPAPVVTPQEGSAPGAPEREDGGLQARVRAALRCPYCRESLTPEELQGGDAPGAAQLTSRRDLVALTLLAGAALLVSTLWRSGPVPQGWGWAVSGGIGVFLVLRNLGALVSARYGLGELVREAWGLWRRGETQVSERGAAVGCARAGCGAVYHTECWDECRVSYGACAVFGCGSHEVRALSARQLRLRGLRLLLAAFLFPQRLLDSVRQVEDEQGELARLREAIRARARETHRRLWSGSGSIWFSLVQLGVTAGVGLLGYAAPFLLGVGSGDDERAIWSLGCGTGAMVLAAVALYGGSWLGALGLYAAKSLLSTEFTALARLGQQGAFLSRAKGGKK